MTVTVYFIRHGQSEDNLRPIWAGWKDAPLSSLGERQAAALGASLAHTTFTEIFSSDLKRAHATAQALHAALASDTKPPLTVTRGLREQNFGAAESHPWTEARVPVDAAAGVFPILSGRAEAFPGGESLDALRARAARDVLDALLMPHVWRARGGEATVACVSHGLCISELCAAILERAPDDVGKRYAFAGLANTAWHCLRIGMKGEERGEAGTGEMDVNAPLTVEVVKMNESAHLKTITTADAQPSETVASKLRQYLSGKAANL